MKLADRSSCVRQKVHPGSYWNLIDIHGMFSYSIDYVKREENARIYYRQLENGGKDLFPVFFVYSMNKILRSHKAVSPTTPATLTYNQLTKAYNSR